MGSRVTFSPKMLLLRVIKGASKKPLGSPQLHVVVELRPSQVSLFNGKSMEGPTKKTRFPAFFGTFPILMYFGRGNPGTSKNPSGTSQRAVVPEIWPSEVSISLENMRQGQTWQTRQFSQFLFFILLEAQNNAPDGHLIGPFFLRGLPAALGRYLLVIVEMYCRYYRPFCTLCAQSDKNSTAEIKHRA